MKKLLSVLFAAAVIVLPLQALAQETPALSLPPEIAAEAAILMDADTGQILYGKNETVQMHPASLTKIMTCLLALELGNTDDLVTVTQDALKWQSISTNMSLKEGEILTMDELLYGLMLPSANDAANAIAIHLAGSARSFADIMNERAASLGLTGTHFQNAHGLSSKNHYTTAYDLAEMTRAALAYPDFLRYAGTQTHTISATNISGVRSLKHSGQMLSGGTYAYDGAVAGKTGWTPQAGCCLMTVAEQGDTTLICIVLKSDGAGSQYKDTQALLDYGFQNFQRTSLSIADFADTIVSFADAGGEVQNSILSIYNIEATVLLPLGYGEEDVLVDIPLPTILTENDLDMLCAELYLVTDESVPVQILLETIPLSIKVDVAEPVMNPTILNAAVDDRVSAGFLFFPAAAVMLGAIATVLYSYRKTITDRFKNRGECRMKPPL